MDLRLYVSVKRWDQSAGASAALSAVFTVKMERFWRRRRAWSLRTPTPVGFSFGLLFRLLVLCETKPVTPMLKFEIFSAVSKSKLEETDLNPL